MQLAGPVLFFLLLSCSLCDAETRNVTSILKVTNGGQWGKWGERRFCPKSEAKGFSLKVQPKQGLYSDDTSLNGIRLICADGSIITSIVGEHGTWSDAFLCPSGLLTSFSLRVMQPRLLRDNTAANNIKFKCTDGSVLEGNGHAWGDYGAWSTSCKGDVICGIQTKVEIVESSRWFFKDSTGLNDVRLFCCSPIMAPIKPIMTADSFL